MVIVDDGKRPYGRMLMSHMVADTEDELHAMADKIGIARRWYQDRSSTPHYDVCQAKRSLAVEYGAVEFSTRELVHWIRARRRAMLDAARKENP